MAPTPSSADALVRRRRGFELIKQNAGRLSGEAYSANRRMLTTFKKYSDPGIYHRWVVGALENVGTDAVPEVADLLRVMKDAHPKSGAIMLERIGAGLRDGTASGGKTVGPAGREVDREELIAGLTDHFHGTRPEPEQEVSRDRLTTAPRRAGPAVGSKPILDSYGRDLLRVSDDEAVPPAEGRAGGAPPLSSFGPGVQGRPLALGTPPPDRPATSRQSGLFHQASAAPAVTKPAVRQSGLPGETAKQPVHQAGEPSGLLKQASAHVTKEELDRIEEKYRELIPLADLRAKNSRRPTSNIGFRGREEHARSRLIKFAPSGKCRPPSSSTRSGSTEIG